MIQQNEVATKDQDTDVARQGQEQRPLRQGAPRSAIAPIDAYETDSTIVILADMPGVEQDQLDITVESGVLTIRGRTSQHAPDGFGPIYQEFESTDFQRTITLSDQIDTGQVKAAIDNGVLRLELRKQESAKPRKIPVQSS